MEENGKPDHYGELDFESMDILIFYTMVVQNITEAILWHGGEATTSKEAFKNLTAEERSDLLAFINAL